MSRRRQVNVVVHGGGTSTGIAALLAGQVDLALSSRPLTSAELERGAQTAAAIQAWPVAIEAIAIITHPAVSIDRLDLPALGRLLDGSITDWSALAAAAGVVIVGRAGASGTASVVEDKLLDQRPLASSARCMPSARCMSSVRRSRAGRRRNCSLSVVAPRPGGCWKRPACGPPRSTR